MTKLYRFELLSDVFVDACLRDASGKLMFLSCYGRDTSIQQMFSAFTLPQSQGGLDTFQLRDTGGNGRRHSVDVGDAERLGKHTGRLPRDNLFGNLVHAWVYDLRLQQADYANRVAWLMDRKETLVGDRLGQRLWDVYRQLSPVPLLDHWREPLMNATSSEYVTPFNEQSTYEPLGDIAAYRVQLEDSFLDTVSALVKSRVLTLTDKTAERLAA